MFAPFFHSYSAWLFPDNLVHCAVTHSRLFPESDQGGEWHGDCGPMITIMDAAHKILEDISLIDVQHARPAVRTSTTPGSGLSFIALDKNRHSWIIHEEDIYFYCSGVIHSSFNHPSGKEGRQLFKSCQLNSIMKSLRFNDTLLYSATTVPSSLSFYSCTIFRQE